LVKSGLETPANHPSTAQQITAIGSPSNTYAASTQPGYDSKAMPLSTNINTPNADLAPFRYGDRLYFTTQTTDAKSTILSNIFSAVNDGPASVWSEGSKNVGAQTANLTLSADGQKAFYNICETAKNGGTQTCELYSRERAFEGYWLPYKRLPRSINVPGYISTQPTFGYSRALHKDVLFFASNRPGGKGGMDIWCCPIERNGAYGQPFSLPFNTEADEVTPFFHQMNQMLYFSARKPDGDTGFDIYKSANTWTGKDISHWSEPEKLEAPFNSKADDFYFTWHAGSGKAYFSSNRLDSLNYDIFEADIQTPLVAKVFDASDSTAIVGYRLHIKPIGAGATAALPALTNGAETRFLLELDQKYRLVATATGYQSDTLEVTAEQASAFATLHQPIFLKPKARLLVRTYNAIDSLPLGGVALQLGLEGQGERTFVRNKESEVEHSFQVGVGDVISLVAMKSGFVTTYAKPNAEFRFAPTADAHLSVYLSPFTEAPVALYFDNDEPKWEKATDTKTSLTYDDTYQEYLKRKQVFVDNYVEGLNETAAEAARLEINSFFEEEVETNRAKLDRLCSQLENYLAKGYELEMLTVGEASPLASMDYNQRLISRRISSVVNQLKAWNNGALRKYFDNGQLLVSTEMKVVEGEGEKVQVKLSDRRQLEFSPEASMMRKVLIEGVRRQKSKV
jgi:hypothetical protein